MGLLDVVYRDAWVIAVNKPSGLLVHRSRKSSDHVFALQLVRDEVGQFVHPIHRLDRATSGVLLFGMDPDTTRVLCAQFGERAVEKRYLAVVRGYTDEEGVIDHPLREDAEHDLQSAVTVYRRLATVECPGPVAGFVAGRYSLLELRPQTGRMHQLRRHCSHISHPIIGDTTYGDSRHNRFFREQFQCHRLLLHAVELCLTHPHTGELLVLRAPVPADMTAVLGVLGLV